MAIPNEQDERHIELLRHLAAWERIRDGVEGVPIERSWTYWAAVREIERIEAELAALLVMEES